MLVEKNIFSENLNHILAKFPNLPQPPNHNEAYVKHDTIVQTPKPVVDATVDAWVVKVMLNKEQQLKLAEFLALLQQKGFPAFIPQYPDDAASLLVGPELDEQTAINISNQLKQVFNLPAKVVKYDTLAL